MTISNRKFLFGSLAAAFLLAACGDGSAPETESAETTKAAESAKPTEPGTTIDARLGPADGIFGTLELPAPGAPGWAEAQQTYLKSFSAQGGVRRTEGGVYYAVLEEGGGAQPEPGQTVQVHYEGRLVTGKVFDSSYQRGAPAEFATTQVIQGWQEILPMMQEGATWQVAIPAELAYGSRAVGNGLIPPDSALVFTIELLQVKG